MQTKPLTLTILDIVSIILLGVLAYLALVFAPTELVMGDVQRVFYFHIGTAWTALMGFILAAVFSVTYLVSKNLKWDRLQVASIEVSMVFFIINMAALGGVGQQRELVHRALELDGHAVGPGLAAERSRPRRRTAR